MPLGDSLQIRGAVTTPAATGVTTFVPEPGTNGFFARPIMVPGGLLGIDLPIPGNMIAATAELAGPPSSIRFDLNTASVAFPLKLRLSNPLIGPHCHIGSNTSPINVNLITGTTNPPPPNRPISGRVGTVTFLPTYVLFDDNVNVDNTFSVPRASNCGYLGLGLIDLLVNARLGLPSASGNNTLITTNDIAIGGL